MDRRRPDGTCRAGLERVGRSGVDVSAVLFDLDGVLAPTSVLHRKAWGELFVPYLDERGADRGYSESDYYALIDGRPRFEGVAAVLESRGIRLSWGSPDDPASADTVCGLGNRKNLVFEELLAGGQLMAYPETAGMLAWLRTEGKRLAVVSSSRNAGAVLAAIGVADEFAVVVDGIVAERHGLPGKPDPATFRYAAAALGVAPECAVVVEDATFGVAAGRAGEFGLVVGVDRGAGAAALLSAGADLVVDSLAGLRECWPEANGAVHV